MIRVGDIIRDRYGSWLLWRVSWVGADQTYCRGVKLITSKTYHMAGETELVRCADYQVEPDPIGFIHRTSGRWGGFLDPARRFALIFTTR